MTTVGASDVLQLSARIIDSGVVDEPVNRVTQTLSEVADGIAVVESFSHSVAIRTEEGLLVADASGVATGAAVVEAIRGWTDDALNTLVYTHGHVDHVGGSGAFAAAYGPFRVVAHRAVAERFRRYRATDGYNLLVNRRQFGWIPRDRGLNIGTALDHFLPADVVEPDVSYDQTLTLEVGGTRVALNHARGETDDHTWLHLPQHQAVCSGDFLIWNFPNAGNPQKVQRYPSEWAAALRAMAAVDPELLLPAHGLPIAGKDRIARVLDEVATALEDLVRDVVGAMNSGATLDDVLHSVLVPPQTLALPYLRPLYDEPEFVVRNIWRLYGGWYDGNPARLKPPTDASLAREVAALAGGAEVLADRAEAATDIRLACQLIEWAHAAAPGDESVGRRRIALYRQRSDQETSLMAKGIFRSLGS